jgi:osmoprotectant transport system permease protein
VGIVTLLFLAQPRALYPVLAALTVLAVPSIVLGTAAGIETVDRDVRDAARGIGLSPMQVLRGVEIPNALPLIFAGVRSAANQVLATATVAGFGFGLGGLGRFIYSGYSTQRLNVVYGATILVITLVLLVEFVLATLQRLTVSPGVRAQVRRRALPADATSTSTLPSIPISALRATPDLGPPDLRGEQT